MKSISSNLTETRSAVIPAGRRFRSIGSDRAPLTGHSSDSPMSRVPEEGRMHKRNSRLVLAVAAAAAAGMVLAGCSGSGDDTGGA